jgi:3' terminal RNA ribose 2'-O-methyltransferase Hen1
MLLTLSTTHRPASDLGYLLHKHPDRFQSFDLSFGLAHVFYPELGSDPDRPDQRATVALLLDVDPVGIVRGPGREQSSLLGRYVNDRPYVASSYLSVAIAQVFGSALAGRSKDRPELVATPLPLTARIEVLPVRGGPDFLNRVFEPLGYTVKAARQALDAKFPEWGESPYYSVTISATKTVAELLTHLYVLVPVFDNDKHYFVGDDELEKLLEKGAGWLAEHPEKDQITRRYLKHRSGLYREALARLVDEEAADEPLEGTGEVRPKDEREDSLERPLSLNEQRHGVVLATLRACGARSVLDLGCGEGKFVRQLLDDRQFERIVGLDVSVQSLQRAVRRLGYDRLPEKQKQRVELLHGSLIYRDERIAGFDAAAVIEVIEHLDPSRLRAFERVLFEFARPKTVLVTTPNREYNRLWETLPAGAMRHPDHRFEWTRAEFRAWAEEVAARRGYRVRFLPIGPEDAAVGSPTQMGVFERE